MITRPLSPGTPIRTELWLGAAALVFCIISYPAAVVLIMAPVAGSIGFLSAAGFVGATAGFLGYSRRRPFDRWGKPLLISLGAAAAVGAAAFVFDQVDAYTAVLCALAVVAEMIFAWHFLPWIVMDLMAAEFRPGTGRRFLPRARRVSRPRAALAFALLLGLLSFGLGASWARGEAWVPSPTPWLISLVFLTAGLMFVERMTYFQRSARDGNLALTKGSYSRWTALLLAGFVLLAGLAALVPWRRAPEYSRAARTGSAGLPAPSAAPLSGLPDRGDAAAAIKHLVAAASAAPRALLALWLLLLLLLLGLVVVWGFRRSRAARWLLAALGWLVARIARAWQRLLSALRKLASAPAAPRRAPEAPEEERATDPFFDVFQHPEALAALPTREVVIRTYHLLLNVAEMLGHGRHRGQTPFEYARALVRVAPQARASLRALTWAYSGAMYGGDRVGMPELREVREAWQETELALQSGLSPEDLDLRRRAYLATRRLDAQGRISAG